MLGIGRDLDNDAAQTKLFKLFTEFGKATQIEVFDKRIVDDTNLELLQPITRRGAETYCVKAAYQLYEKQITLR